VCLTLLDSSTQTTPRLTHGERKKRKGSLYAIFGGREDDFLYCCPDNMEIVVCLKFA
jgi:hypothetical protein